MKNFSLAASERTKNVAYIVYARKGLKLDLVQLTASVLLLRPVELLD